MSVSPIGGTYDEIIIEGAQPIQGVTPTDQVQQVEPVSTSIPGVVDISGAGRALASEWIRTEKDLLRQEAINAETIYENNQSVRDLMASMKAYNNTVAVEHYVNYLRTSAVYGNLPPQPAAPTATVQQTTQDRTAMIRRIDSWITGTGVFQPGMIGLPTSEGFMFTPVTEEAMAALGYADILASASRDVLINYLARLAQLTPMNFIFYDPTGLGPLSLIERRDFLSRADELLASANIEVQAADLVYHVNPDVEFDIKMSWEVAEDLRRKVEDALNHGTVESDAENVDALKQYGRRLAVLA